MQLSIPRCGRDDGSPVYEYQPRLGESKGNFNQVVVDTDHWGCLLARRYGGDSGTGRGRAVIATLTNPSWEVFYHSRWNPAGNGEDVWPRLLRMALYPTTKMKHRQQMGNSAPARSHFVLPFNPVKPAKFPRLSLGFPVH